MNLTIKTLKGGKFTVEVEPSSTVAEVKTVIEKEKSELPAASMKLIHSGKVLKDDDKIESCNIKPNDFLVVMIAKAKKAAAPAPAAAAAAPTDAAAATAPTASATSTAAPTTPAPTATNPPTPAASGPSTAAAPSPAAPTADEFPTEMVENLKGMGFPEPEVRACLRASHGNPDVAVEFLMNGIPPGLGASGGGEGGGSTSTQPSAGGSSSGGATLVPLRNHPQFNDLRRLVQSNPSMLQAVLTQIGQQQPDLLQAINANQAEFLRMMNEPVADDPASNAPAPPAPNVPAAANPLEALANPAQLSQMLQNMPPQEQQAMAQMMGMSVEQLNQTAQMISQMPQEQVQQYMNMAMQAQGLGGGMGGMMGEKVEEGHVEEHDPACGVDFDSSSLGGAQVLRLSEEEMAAVDRLTEMGFDRAEAAQAYLACDKNEALAANLLMDGGFNMFDEADGGDMGGDDEGDDDMYD
eukprot:CAMPEP_0171384498 /NCGR_PEP_ID=MMETSP0879-20121228/38501_1 /TAXON_ID=67004 /ORGANISM="Thalassiosira weissflogii, Strain CCMP1336" /LENGTH=465 /DNA_ID=CAMNT_0011896773 /DNA_START=108 /DNA_END=1507 /DNA_ORIENTATION=+